MVESWFDELCRKYKLIRSPRSPYTGEDLDDANEAITIALDKLNKIIKSKEG